MDHLLFPQHMDGHIFIVQYKSMCVLNRVVCDKLGEAEFFPLPQIVAVTLGTL